MTRTQITPSGPASRTMQASGPSCTEQNTPGCCNKEASHVTPGKLVWRANRGESPFRVLPRWDLSGLISTDGGYMTRLPRSTHLTCGFLAARCPIRLSYGRFQFQLYNSIDLLSTTALLSSTRRGHGANLPSSLFLCTLFKLLIHSSGLLPEYERKSAEIRISAPKY